MWDSHIVQYVFHFLDYNFYHKNIIKEDLKSILDFGAGEGWLSIWLRYLQQEQSSDSSTWKTEINAIEIYPQYYEALKKQFYSNVFMGDIFNTKTLKNYDLIICLEVLEHMEKSKALNLVRQLSRDNKYLFFSTTYGFREASEHHGNPYQKHLCGYSEKDFQQLGLKTKVKDKAYLFVFSKELEWEAPLYKKLRRKIIPEKIRIKLNNWLKK